MDMKMVLSTKEVLKYPSKQFNLLTSQGLLGAPGDWKATHPLF